MANKKLYNFDESKKKKHKKEKKPKKNVRKSSNQIDLDNEIIIGVTMRESNTPKNGKKEGRRKRNKKAKEIKQIQKQERIRIDNKPKKKSKAGKIVKWTSILVLIIGLTILIMLSPLFNLKEIIVTGNDIVSTEKIKDMSNFKIGYNLFKLNKGAAKKNIVKNGYIEDVEISRVIPDKIKIKVTERVVQFNIPYGNAYVIVDTQGYITEISEEIKPVPILIGTTTKEENYKENNRLEKVDLAKLTKAIKIYSLSKTNGIEDIITSIDITNENDYIINFDDEEKTAHLGDCSNIGDRISWVKIILEKEDAPGDIMVNMNLNKEQPYFREKID